MGGAEKILGGLKNLEAEASPEPKGVGRKFSRGRQRKKDRKIAKKDRKIAKKTEK